MRNPVENREETATCPVPDREEARLASLQRLRVMDTVEEKVLDNLTELAATICQTPISLISLVDEKRQWFKSHHGLSTRETPRRDAFCAHAIIANELFVVPDTLQDSRFVDNPLVTGAPDIRFYAGAPIMVDDGLNVGTLCVIDRKPRQLDEHQRRSLEILRDAVAAHLELRRARHEIQAFQKLVPVCAWCRKINVARDGSEHEWVDPYDFVVETSITSHGVCSSCAKRFD